MRLHLAGIIPIANMKTDHENPLPEVLIPVDNGFSAIQKSVYECAMAGCSTIWIVANDDLIPLVRKIVGEWVYDPVYYARNYSKFYKEHRKEVPILSFTMTGEDFKLCRRHINKKTSKEYLPPLPGQQYPTQKIPLSQRWSARRFPLSEIFQPLATEQERATKIELSWFYDGTTWCQYIDYITSDHIIEKPYKELVRPHKHEKFSYEES